MMEEGVLTSAKEVADKPAEVWYIQPDVVDYIWPEVEPWIGKAIEEGWGEITLSDVHEFLEQGSLQLFVFREYGKTKLALVAELVTYPQFKAYRVVALGGSRLSAAKAFWPDFCSLAYTRGVARIEALCHARMARALEYYFDFELKYFMVGFDLKGHCNA